MADPKSSGVPRRVANAERTDKNELNLGEKYFESKKLPPVLRICCIGCILQRNLLIKAKWPMKGAIAMLFTATLAPGQKGSSMTSKAHRRAQRVQRPAPRQCLAFGCSCTHGQSSCSELSRRKLTRKTPRCESETHATSYAGKAVAWSSFLSHGRRGGRCAYNIP